MPNLALGSTARVVFSLAIAPDATPVVTCYAGGTLLGTATVATQTGVRIYEATYALPGAGIADETPIYFRVNHNVDSEAQASVDLFAGVVNDDATILAAVGNVAANVAIGAPGVPFGATNQSIKLCVFSPDGTPKTDVTSASAGLAIYYQREGGAATPITISNLANSGAAHSDGGLIHLHGQVYRLDLPNVFGVGANWVDVWGVITGGVIINQRIEISTSVSENADIVSIKGILSGRVTSVDNGDGTWTLSFYAADNVTVLHSVTYNPTTGAREVVA